MRAILEEPLLHFLLAGTLLFAADAFLERGGGDTATGPRREVRVTEGDVAWIAETWARQWQRRPDARELRLMIDEYVREEMLAREARELGLDDDDTIVRRRLAQKMEFLVRDTAYVAPPGEDELRRHYDARPARYGTPARVSFTQIPFDTEAAAREGLEALAADPTAEVGDGGLLDRDHALADERTVSGLFGDDFTLRVFALDPGAWHGPVPSAYGFHLVRIDERQAGRQRPFDDVRAQVLDDWYDARQAEAAERHLAALLEKYDVVVEDAAASLIGPLARAAR